MLPMVWDSQRGLGWPYSVTGLPRLRTCSSILQKQRSGHQNWYGLGGGGWEFCCFDFRNPKLAGIPGCSQPSASCPGSRHPRTCPSTGAVGELRLCYGDITQTRPCSPRHLEGALPLARNQEKVKLTECP